jgi:hypothetical protein
MDRSSVIVESGRIDSAESDGAGDAMPLRRVGLLGTVLQAGSRPNESGIR